MCSWLCFISPLRGHITPEDHYSQKACCHYKAHFIITLALINPFCVLYCRPGDWVLYAGVIILIITQSDVSSFAPVLSIANKIRSFTVDHHSFDLKSVFLNTCSKADFPVLQLAVNILAIAT